MDLHFVDRKLVGNGNSVCDCAMLQLKCPFDYFFVSDFQSVDGFDVVVNSDDFEQKWECVGESKD